ncbi:hypothetical protein, partial [Streptomyces sp. NPDC004285]
TGTAGGGGRGGCGGPAGRTGIRRTVPHGQPSSGWGHAFSWPQAPQRTVTQMSAQFRCLIGDAGSSAATTGATGLPHAHG